jgi:acetolactate synthase small subunit
MAEGQAPADVVFRISAHRRRGVLAKIAGTFDRRALAIRTFTAGESAAAELSTIVVRIDGPCAEHERLAAALRNLMDVVSVELSASD